MIGILIELVASWLLLWFISKKQLTALGLQPTKSRTIDLGVGVLLAAGCCTVYQIATTFFAGNSWAFNQRFNLQTLPGSIWWTLKSVLFEELLFRGALLYIALEKLSMRKACILSGICFGIYHWFSYNALGNPVAMALIFIMTGIFGLMLAYAFAKTKSLYLPVGLHFGWNLLNIVVFSNGPLGQQLFIKTNEHRLEGIISLIAFLFQILALPLLTFLYLRRFSGRREHLD